MSILVRNMEMPKSCRDCGIEQDGFWCGALDGYQNTRCFTNERREDCPLIEVSEQKHGRLIDADALEKEAQKRMLICDKNGNQFQKPYEVMRAISLAPTIIPAEEGEI